MKKNNIVLDLDATLISAEATEDFDFSKEKAKSKLFKYSDMDGYYIVFERPGLQKFLDYLFEHYNVTIWTAASKDYALFVINKIVLQNKRRRLEHIFFSNHCDVSSVKKKGTKDLSTIWDIFNLPQYTLNDTFILDDYDEVYDTQTDNCIIAHPFDFNQSNSENDKFLPELQAQMKPLETATDVKSVIPAINKSMDALED